LTYAPALKFTNHLGRDFNHPAYQLDLPVPFKPRLLDVETYLLFRRLRQKPAVVSREILNDPELGALSFGKWSRFAMERLIPCVQACRA
jgi:hypothetical protein